MKAALFASILLIAVNAFGAEVKKFSFNADNWELGEAPKDVFVVDGTIKIADKDGSKAIMIEPTPIVDASAQLAVSAAGESAIQAKVFASKRARSFPRFGVSVHGMSGYRLIVNAPKKLIELVKGDQVAASAPFTWTPDTWTFLKLEVKKAAGEEWTITGKAWPGDAKEPAAATVKHSDKGLKGQGKAGIWGTPYSETPIYFDDVEIAIEVAPAAAP
jgi:hypothetical protein